MAEQVLPAPPVLDTTTTTITTNTTTGNDEDEDDTTTPRCKTVQIQRHHPVVIRIDGLVNKDKDNKDNNLNNGSKSPEVVLLIGYQAWLRSFWLPAMQRKHPNLSLQVLLRQRVKNNNDDDDHDQNKNNYCKDTVSLILDMSSTSSDITPLQSTSQVEWEKSLTKELKKLVVEDLGPLRAQELWNTIPEHDDKDGRGRNDLARMEHELNVKVVFGFGSGFVFADNNDRESFPSPQQHDLHNHVLLVGPKAKLAKKCFVLRNMLAHYYWRLTGHEVKL